MLRRRSEFFLFLDDARSAKSEKEEHKEEHHPSPREDNLGVLLQVKMTSDVSEKSGFPQVCSAPRIKRKLNPIKLNLCDLYMLEFSSWHPWVGNLSSYLDSQHEGSNFLLLQWMWNHEAATRDADSTCSWGCTHPQSFLGFFFLDGKRCNTCAHTPTRILKSEPSRGVVAINTYKQELFTHKVTHCAQQLFMVYTKLLCKSAHWQTGVWRLHN